MVRTALAAALAEKPLPEAIASTVVVAMAEITGGEALL